MAAFWWANPVAAEPMADIRPPGTSEQIAQGDDQGITGEDAGRIVEYSFEELVIVDRPGDEGTPAASGRSAALSALAQLRYLEYEATRLDAATSSLQVAQLRRKMARLDEFLAVYDEILRSGDVRDVLFAAFMKGMVLVELAQALTEVPYPDDLPPDDVHWQEFQDQMAVRAAAFEEAGLSTWLEGLEAARGAQVCNESTAILAALLRGAGMEIPPKPAECRSADGPENAPDPSLEPTHGRCPTGLDRDCIAGVLVEARRGIAGCYALRRGDRPGLSGRLVIRLVFVRPGIQVSHVEVDEVGDPLLSGCVEAMLWKAGFPEVPGLSWSVRVPFRFVAGVGQENVRWFDHPGGHLDEVGE